MLFMDKQLPPIRLSTKLFPSEDADLIALLLPLPRVERSRRVRALLRAGLGSTMQKSVEVATAHVTHLRSEPTSSPLKDNLDNVGLDFEALEFNNG
jgi:hypothetical protein